MRRRGRHRARKASIGGGLSNEAVRFLSDEFPSNDDRRLFNKTPSSWTEQDIEMLEGMMSYLSEEWFLLEDVIDEESGTLISNPDLSSEEEEWIGAAQSAFWELEDAMEGIGHRPMLRRGGALRRW